MNQKIEVAHLHIQTFEADWKSVLEKEHRFPGAAALVAELEPYYTQAMTVAKTAGNVGHAKHTTKAAHQQDYGHLPDALAREVRSQLTSLQESALKFEANNTNELAEEIRSIATTISTMLKTVKQMSQPEMATPLHNMIVS